MSSKHYSHKNDQNKIDLTKLLTNKDIPSFILDSLNKKKTIDLTSIRNIHINQRMSS